MNVWVRAGGNEQYSASCQVWSRGQCRRGTGGKRFEQELTNTPSLSSLFFDQLFKVENVAERLLEDIVGADRFSGRLFIHGLWCLKVEYAYLALPAK
jgi:hypothetical protein